MPPEPKRAGTEMDPPTQKRIRTPSRYVRNILEGKGDGRTAWCQEFPIPNMPNTHTHIASPSNNASDHHHRPYQPYPGKLPPSSSSQPPHSLPKTTNHYDQPTHRHYDTKCTQPPIPKRIHPYPTGTHDPWHGNLGHLGHTGPGPFGTTVNHDPSIFNYNRILGT